MSIKVRLLSNAILEQLMLHVEEFDIVEKIVCLFKEHHIDCGDCHNFN